MASHVHHYRPEIDGLRALAVGAVIIFHSGWALPGGFVGVDVFFVISGFLIASLLARELDAGTFRLARFWERRVRRILPANVAMVLATLIVGGLLCLPRTYADLAGSVVANSLLSANVFFWRSRDYFGDAAATKPLLHMWSLAVEEQFYVLFPVVLAGLWPRGRTVTVAVLATMAAASFAVSLAGITVARSAAFFLLPARAWELLVGVLLALTGPVRCDRNCHPAVRSSAAILGLIAIAVACVGFSAATPFPGWHAAIPCGGAALFIWSQGSGPVGVGRVLAWAPVRVTGQMSYSLYLWHWPVMAFLRQVSSEPTDGAMGGAILATAGLSVLSWRFIEEPFRKRFRQCPTWGVLAAGVCASLVLLVAGVAVTRSGGLPGRFPPPTLFYGTASDARAEEHPQIPFGFRATMPLPTVGAQGPEARRLPVVLWGDSHAGFIAPVLHRIGMGRGLSIPVAVSRGKMPIPGVWDETEDVRVGDAMEQVFQAVQRAAPTDVIWAARWSWRIPGLVDRPSGRRSDESGAAVMRRGIRRAIERLQGAGVKRIWICLEVPLQTCSPAQVALRNLYLGEDVLSFGVSREEHHRQQEDVREIFDEFRDIPGCHFITLADACFSEDGLARVQSPDGPLYLDDNHLSDLGAERFLRTLFESLISRIVVPPDSAR
jgi:peptidoglycan/LPS O-acetylase OafA/YrhL